MNQDKIASYIVGFLVIFSLLFSSVAIIIANNSNQDYAKDTERVTKLVEALENDTTNIKPNITLEEALKLVSDDSKLSSVKKEIKYLEDTYPTDHEYKISSLSSRVNEVELKLNQQIKDIKEEKERENQAKSSEEAYKNSKESENKSKEETKKIDLDAYYNAIQTGVDKVNTSVRSQYARNGKNFSSTRYQNYFDRK